MWSSTSVYTQVLNAWTKSTSSVRVFVQMAKKLSNNPRVWARCEKDLEDGVPDDARFFSTSTFLCSPVARKLIPNRADYTLTGEFLGWAMDHVYISGGPKINMASIGPFRWTHDATKYVSTCLSVCNVNFVVHAGTSALPFFGAGRRPLTTTRCCTEKPRTCRGRS